MAALTITNAGNNLLRDALGTANDSTISYVAIGTGSTAPAVTDSALVNETFRKKVTSYANGSSVGEVLINCFLSTSDANGTVIAEVGIFGGTSASATLGSGVLVGRGLYSHTKSSAENLQLQFDIIV